MLSVLLLDHLPHPTADHLQSRIFGKGKVIFYHTDGEVGGLMVEGGAETQLYVLEYLAERNTKILCDCSAKRLNTPADFIAFIKQAQADQAEYEISQAEKAERRAGCFQGDNRF